MFSYNHSQIDESSRTLTEAEVYYDANVSTVDANKLPAGIPVATPVYDDDTASDSSSPSFTRTNHYRHHGRHHRHHGHGFCPFRLARRAKNKIAAKRIHQLEQKGSRYTK